jgi:hypothetical protein
MKTRNRAVFKAGEVYAVPLQRNGDTVGWAVALITETARQVLTVSQFLNRRFDTIPDVKVAMAAVKDALDQRNCDVKLTVLHGVHGIRHGDWLYLGKLAQFPTENLPPQEFYEENTDWVCYADGRLIRQARSAEDRGLPKFWVAGAGFLEGWLDKVIAET